MFEYVRILVLMLAVERRDVLITESEAPADILAGFAAAGVRVVCE